MIVVIIIIWGRGIIIITILIVVILVIEILIIVVIIIEISFIVKNVGILIQTLSEIDFFQYLWLLVGSEPSCLIIMVIKLFIFIDGFDAHLWHLRKFD